MSVNDGSRAIASRSNTNADITTAAGSNTSSATCLLERPRAFSSLPAQGKDGLPTPLFANFRPPRAPALPRSSAGGLEMTQGFSHVPVMLSEVLEILSQAPPGLVLDATVGGGSHAEALLSAREDVLILGIDRDPEAVVAAQERLERFGERARVVQARFDALGEIVAGDERWAGHGLSGALFDLGVSSHQLDVAPRGFSFSNDGPLDMRMDPGAGETAAELLDRLDEVSLSRLLAEHGEERHARRIARAVRAARPLSGTRELAEVVAAAVPAAERRRGHPARRVFQALRVVVNDELSQLRPALEETIALLVPGGRIAVLAYHSGEDRVVKSCFLEATTGGCTCPPGLPCGCGALASGRLLARGARKASAEEVEANPRSKSARLRGLERLEPFSPRGALVPSPPATPSHATPSHATPSHAAPSPAGVRSGSGAGPSCPPGPVQP